MELIMDETIINFFENMTEFGTENKLSDLIAAVCNTSSEIKKVVLKFFFPDHSLADTYTGRIGREFYSDDKVCRVDFCIDSPNGLFLIENKIGDRNDHYNEYSERWDISKIAFIANYEVSSIKYRYKYTWDEFYEYLENHLSEFSESDCILAKGLLKYISGVCCIVEERDYDVNKVSDLGYLLKIFENLLISHGYEIDNRAKGSKSNRSGIWGWNESKKQYIWLGLYYSLNDFSIWCGKTNFQVDDNKVKKLNYSTYDNGDNTDGAYWFEMNKNVREKVKSTVDYALKYQIFTKYLEEIIEL